MDYSPEVERRFDAPAGAGDPDASAPGVLEGSAEDRTLNVWIRFRVQVQDGVIRDARFRVYGCPHTVAAASWTAEWLRGREAAALRQLDIERMRAELDVPVEKLGKLLRVEDAVRACAAQLAQDDRADRASGP